MKKLMFIMIVFAMMAAISNAAVISFSGPVDASSTSSLDTEWLTGGDYVEGVTYGSGVKSFTTAGGQEITLAASNGTDLGNFDMPAEMISEISGYYNANEQWVWNGGPDTDVLEWTDALKGNLWHTNSSDEARPLTLHLAGLIVGQEYSVSLFSTDARTTDRDQAYWSSYSNGIFSGGTSGSFTQSVAYKITGVFVADNVYQDIFIQATDLVGNADTTLSAYTLYTVPEPASMSLLVLGGIMLRSRR